MSRIVGTTENWLMRRRNGLPTMTRNMMRILQDLRVAKNADEPFPMLLNAKQKTLDALFERDWVFASPGHDGTRYTITGRGLKALSVYEAAPRYHFDKTCPTCGQRPRGTFSSGKRMPYCVECNRAHGRKQFAMKGWQVLEDRLCSRCKKRPCHEFPSGKRITYCTHCRKVLRKTERKRKVKRKLWLISIGRPPICLKCDSPVYHTTRSVYDYCYTHYREYQNAYQAKQKAKAS